MGKYILIAIAVAVVVIIGYLISTYNFFKNQKQNIEQSRSNIEVALTNRYDALVKINKSVSAYCGHEASTFTDTVKLRKGMSTEELNALSSQMDKAYLDLSVVVESYPELKASHNFLQMQDSIMDLENTLQATRRIFNREVSDYNKKVNSFPSNLIAGMANATVEPYFTAEERKLKDVELQF